MLQHRFVLWSGVLGATASCIAKLALSSALVIINDNDDSGKGGGLGPIPPLTIPFPYMYQTCQAQLNVPPYYHQDLDSIILKMIYLVLGELLVKYHIGLVRPFHRILQFLQQIGLLCNIFEIDWCHAILLVPRIGGLVTVLVLNGFMIAYFVKGIQASGSIAGPALSSAMNFITSAMYGYLLWGETFSELWWIGFISVLMGVVVLSTVPATRSEAASSSAPASRLPPPPSRPPKIPLASPSSWIKSITTTQPVYGQINVASGGSKHRYDRPPPSISVRKKDSSSGMGGLINAVVPKTFQKMNIKKISKSAWMDRTFVNQCPLCDGQLFDDVTGQSPMAVADLSPACFHIFHAKCLKQQSASDAATAASSPTNAASSTMTPRRSSTQATGCPICEKTISMWISAKQAAHFAGFWMDRVEAILVELGPTTTTNQGGNNDKGPQPVPAQQIRDRLKLDPTLTAEQIQYIDDDPTGLGKGLQSALEWGGYVDYNTTGTRKGHIGWSSYLRSRGIWSYNPKQDDLWLWKWNIVHPRQRCDGCQFWKRPLPIQCQGCIGSSECAFYCSVSCQKRDWQRHKLLCETWQAHCGSAPST